MVTKDGHLKIIDFGTALEEGALAARLDASAGSSDRQYCAGFDGKLTRRGGGEASAKLVATPVGKQGGASGASKF